jgi:hypothetical protein
MSRGLPRVVAVHLEKAKESAVAAVDCYNRSGTRFRSGSYIVLMCIAWTSLLHAVFFKRKVKPFYRDRQNPKRYVRIDGDYKGWELATCLDQYFPGVTSPVVENLKFLIGLRNKIEHRSMPELDLHIFGECQACLFNFEDVLLTEFGSAHCLTECLSLAIQFSRLRNEEQSQTVARLHKPLRADIRQYIDAFRSSLSNRLTEDLRFSYKVFLIPKVANHQGQADVAVEFVKFDPTKPDEMAQYEKRTALIKPAVSHVVNAGRLKAGDVCKRVEPVVKQACGKGCCFTASYHHAKACAFYKVRPKKGDPHPEKTRVEFCQYDAAHKDYVFTEQWVAFLIEEMKKPGQYQKVLDSKRQQASVGKSPAS